MRRATALKLKSSLIRRRGQGGDWITACSDQPKGDHAQNACSPKRRNDNYGYHGLTSNLQDRSPLFFGWWRELVFFANRYTSSWSKRSRNMSFSNARSTDPTTLEWNDRLARHSFFNALSPPQNFSHAESRPYITHCDSG